MNQYRKNKTFRNYTGYTVLLQTVIDRLYQLESRQDYLEKNVCSKYSSQEDQIQELTQKVQSHELLD